MTEILRVDKVTKQFIYQKNLFRKIIIKAVDEISFSLNQGETIAIIGQNGSGKSTLAKLLVGLLMPDEGSIFVNGILVNNVLVNKKEEQLNQSIRMVFQLSETQFNPRLTIGELLEVPLKLQLQLTAQDRYDLILNTLKQVGLSQSHLHYYPMSMAPGQRQRVALARALIVKPKVIVLDESFSSLDISSYSQMINLMLDLQKKYNIAYIYISHNLGVIQHISDRLIVMDEGKIIEQGITSSVIKAPQQEVTKKLVRDFYDLTMNSF